MNRRVLGASVVVVLVALAATVGVLRGVGPARPLAAPAPTATAAIGAATTTAVGGASSGAAAPLPTSTTSTTRPEPERPDLDPVAMAEAGPHLLVVDRPYDVRIPVRAAVVPAGDPDVRVRTDLPCERVHMAAGVGVCLTLGYDPRLGSAFLFDERFELIRTIDAFGLPSRARVSPDGRWVATTFFAGGHSYEGTDFQVQTRITEVASGDTVDLSEFRLFGAESIEVDRSGDGGTADLDALLAEEERMPDGSIPAPSGKVWGVTFTGGTSFLATAMLGATPYLVAGDVATRRLQVVLATVECPSVSPDGTRVVFKRRVGERPTRWELWLLDLRTLETRPLAETRSIDDQVLWLDDRSITYEVPGRRPTVVVLDVDGTAGPQPFLEYATSPVAVGPVLRGS